MIGLDALEGRLRHCVRYKTGAKGRKVCARYSAGAGKPRGRKKAGILRRFIERSKTTKRAHRICAKWGRKSAKTGRKRCLRWRAVSAAALRRRRKGYCMKWGTRKGVRVCRKRAHSVKRTWGTKKRTGRKTKRSGTKKRSGASKKKVSHKRGLVSKAVMKKYEQMIAAREAGMEGFGSPRRRRRRTKTRRTARRVYRRRSR